MTVCKTWQQRDANHWRGLCVNTFHAVGDVNECQICPTPVAVIPPTGCFGCPPSETFPGIWDFQTGFDVTYPGGQTVVTSDSTAYPVLGTVYPGETAPATATVNLYMPTGITTLPLSANIDVAGNAQCIWTNGAWEASGWLHRATYGGLTTTGTCSITPESTGKRVTYSGSGHWVGEFGQSSAGGIGEPCYADLSKLLYANVPEISPSLPPLSLNGLAGVQSVACMAGNVTYYAFPLQLCWNWEFRQKSGAASNVAALYLTIKGYRTVQTDKLVKLAGTYYGNSYPVGISGDATRNAGLAALYNALTNIQTGSARWAATYPCGNPSSITLTLENKSQALATSPLPSSVTLIRAD